MKQFVLGFSTCATLAFLIKKLHLGTPTVYFGGFNRGNAITTANKVGDSVLIRFCKSKHPEKYKIGEKVDKDDIGDPIVDLAFLDPNSMPLLASTLMQEYAAWIG